MVGWRGGGAESQLKAGMLGVEKRPGRQRYAGKKEKKHWKKVRQAAAAKLGVQSEAAMHCGLESLGPIRSEKP